MNPNAAIAKLAGNYASPDFRMGTSHGAVRLLTQSAWDGFTRGGVGVETANRPNGLTRVPTFNADAFKRACMALVKRHPVLTSIMENREGAPWLLPGRVNGPSLHVLNGHHCPAIAHAVDDLVWTPFDIFTGPMCRAYAVINAADGDYIGFVLHHLIGDGTSIQLLMQEFRQLYRNGLDRVDAALPAPSVSFMDYAHTLGSWYDSHAGRIARQEARRAASSAGKWAFGADLDADRAESEVFAFDKAIANQVRAFARDANTTVFTVLLLAQQITLQRYCSTANVPIKILTSGRDASALLRTIGNLADRIYAVTDLSGTPTLSDLIVRLHAALASARRHAFVREDVLRHDLAHEGIELAAPAFNFRSMRRRTAAIDGRSGYQKRKLLVGPPKEVLQRRPKDVYSLTMSDDGEILAGSIRYGHGQIRGFLPALEGVLERFTTPAQPLSDFSSVR